MRLKDIRSLLDLSELHRSLVDMKLLSETDSDNYRTVALDFLGISNFFRSFRDSIYYL